MIYPVYSHFMPRIGFAYDVFGNGRTSFRGGVGQFYDTRLPGVFDNIFANTVPFVASVNQSFATTATSKPALFNNPYASVPGGNVFPAPQPPPANYFTTTNYQNASYSTFNPATFHVPVYYSFNLAVQQQLTKSISGQAAYVGSLGFHQINPTDINPVVELLDRTSASVFTTPPSTSRTLRMRSPRWIPVASPTITHCSFRCRTASATRCPPS